MLQTNWLGIFNNNYLLRKLSNKDAIIFKKLINKNHLDEFKSKNKKINNDAEFLLISKNSIQEHVFK